MAEIDKAFEHDPTRNVGQHPLGSVTIPRGLEVVQGESSMREDFTRWSVIKDLRDRVPYFRGYVSHAFRAIRLPRLDLQPEAKRLALSMPAGGGIIDVTGDLSR